MSEQHIQDSPAGHSSRPTSTWARGMTVFAGVIMAMGGTFQAFAGVVALANDAFYVTTTDYVIEFDTTLWGWIHLGTGILVLLAGFAVLNGQLWGRVVGISLAVISALINFAFIPIYPLWSITIIALDVFVIWALALHGRDITR
ncbi:DUF7144 family membrane protein [Nocardioides alcanivorans]|uniref:DUF7144 family membrane protein n=1 Tax=Nocardioides alcanivorans TaxID=2897352 RepID=UPI001F293119|nr:hypothetical protein [Nocardioides alcanivorans]